MKKLNYLLCLLIVISCSDDPDEIFPAAPALSIDNYRDPARLDTLTNLPSYSNYALHTESNYALQELMISFADQWGWMSYEIQLPVHEYTFTVSENLKLINIGYRDYFSGETTHLFELFDEDENVLFSEAINFHSDWGYRGNDVIPISPIFLQKGHTYKLRKTSTNLSFNNIIIPKGNQAFEFPLEFGQLTILSTRIYGDKADKALIDFGIPFMTIGLIP